MTVAYPLTAKQHHWKSEAKEGQVARDPGVKNFFSVSVICIWALFVSSTKENLT